MKMDNIVKKIDRRFVVIEDKKGNLYLFAFDGVALVYAHDEFEHGALAKDLESLANGVDLSKMEGNDENPAKLLSEVMSTEWDWQIIADNNGIYPKLMGPAGLKEVLGVDLE